MKLNVLFLAVGTAYWWGDMPVQELYHNVVEIFGSEENIQDINFTLPNKLEINCGPIVNVSCGKEHMAVVTCNQFFLIILK